MSVEILINYKLVGKRMGIEHAVTKRGRIILPLALSAGLALSGCATTFPSSEQVREKKQKSALEKATYSSIYEESFMRGLPQGEDRDQRTP